MFSAHDESLQPLLEMRNICKSFPGVRALDDVSLQLARGEVLALVGEITDVAHTSQEQILALAIA